MSLSVVSFTTTTTSDDIFVHFGLDVSTFRIAERRWDKGSSVSGFKRAVREKPEEEDEKSARKSERAL